MMKVVVKLDLHDDRGKQKALKAVSALHGIESMAMDMKEKKLTVIGDVDPVCVVAKVRKHWPNADIVSVGPAKEEKKKEEPKKEAQKPKPKSQSEQIEEMIKLHKNMGYPIPTYVPNYYVYGVEENPNSCVIC